MYRVKVHGRNVMLPNGSVYKDGEEAVLTDLQFFVIHPAIRARVISVLEQWGSDGLGVIQQQAIDSLSTNGNPNRRLDDHESKINEILDALRGAGIIISALFTV